MPHTVERKARTTVVVVVRGKIDREDALVLWTQVRRERSLERLPVIRPTDPCLEQRAVLAVAEEVGVETASPSARSSG